MEYFKALALTLVLFASLTYSEVIRTQKCYIPAGRQSTCTVHEVRIDPCPEAAENKPCKIKLGTIANITFEYTPTWSATKLGSQAFKVGGALDIGFEQMNTDGCLYTTCPVEANKRQTYIYSIDLSKQFPASNKALALQMAINSATKSADDNHMPLNDGKMMVVSFAHKTEPSFFPYFVKRSKIGGKHTVFDSGVIDSRPPTKPKSNSGTMLIIMNSAVLSFLLNL